MCRWDRYTFKTVDAGYMTKNIVHDQGRILAGPTKIRKAWAVRARFTPSKVKILASFTTKFIYIAPTSEEHFQKTPKKAKKNV